MGYPNFAASDQVEDHIGTWYLTNFPPSQNAVQGYFKVGSYARIETHAWTNQKMLGPVGILLWTQPCKAGTGWGDGPLSPWDQANVTKRFIPPTRGAPVRILYCACLSTHAALSSQPQPRYWLKIAMGSYIYRDVRIYGWENVISASASSWKFGPIKSLDSDRWRRQQRRTCNLLLFFNLPTLADIKGLSCRCPSETTRTIIYQRKWNGSKDLLISTSSAWAREKKREKRCRSNDRLIDRLVFILFAFICIFY